MSSNLRTLADNVKSAKLENPEVFLRFKIMREWPLGQDSMKILSVKTRHLTSDFIAQARNLVVESTKTILTFNFASTGDSSFGTNRAISAIDIEDPLYQALLVEAHKNGFRITLRVTNLEPKGISEQNLRDVIMEQQEIGAFYLS
jgi:hypothetical protein